MSKDRKDSANKEYSNEVYTIYYNHIFNLALSRFEYEGLPNGLTAEIIETQLILDGQVMFFLDEDDGVYKCLSAKGTGNINIYGLPTSYNTYGHGGGFYKTIDEGNGVLIKNNPTRTSELYMIMYYADKIDDIEQSKYVNLEVNNMPFFIKTSKAQEFTWKNIFKQIRDRKFVIYGFTDKLGNSDIEVLKTDAKFLQAEYQDAKNEVLNEVLSFLGINNTPTDKKERLLVDEVNSNNHYIVSNIDLMFKERERAIKMINEKYGLNIVVKKRELQEMGVEEDGKVLNRVTQD